MQAAANASPVKGWFKIKGVQDGDRTIDEQLLGLDPLAGMVSGKTVLDLGCAEGLIGRHLVDAGAAQVDGVNVVDHELAAARRLNSNQPMRFYKAHLGNHADRAALDTELLPQYDVVLLLSVLHKVKNPQAFLEWAVAKAAEAVVIRLPAPVLVHVRSQSHPYPVREWMSARYDLVAQPKTCRKEWLGYFKVRAGL